MVARHYGKPLLHAFRGLVNCHEHKGKCQFLTLQIISFYVENRLRNDGKKPFSTLIFTFQHVKNGFLPSQKRFFTVLKAAFNKVESRYLQGRKHALSKLETACNKATDCYLSDYQSFSKSWKIARFSGESSWLLRRRLFLK